MARLLGKIGDRRRARPEKVEKAHDSVSKKVDGARRLAPALVQIGEALRLASDEPHMAIERFVIRLGETERGPDHEHLVEDRQATGRQARAPAEGIYRAPDLALAGA